MLKQQREYFDLSLKAVTDKVTALEKEMSRGFAEIQHNTDELKHLFQIGGKALDHTITSIGQVMGQSVTLENNQIELKKKALEHNFKTCEEVGKFKEEAINTLSIEIRKGENLVKEYLEKSDNNMKTLWEAKLKDMNATVHAHSHEVKLHTYDAAV
ncbi:hypothetical protein KSP39_PZI020369 [Platanthera zijinensis]|uniref:Uncharacterized protein n=1 Tax=Platanthera zijinensis TaxID=2320716 RepID=A0AAP0FX84_9ASPA